jgi:hypothetical protein
MSAESLDENKERASCAPEVHHVYPFRGERLVKEGLGGQRVACTMESSGSSCSLERALEGTVLSQREATNRGGMHM